VIKIEVECTFKLCLFGDGGVGKTTLTRRFLTGLFELDTKITMGAVIFVKYLEIDGRRVSIQVWDFGGEKQFRFLIPVYAHGSSAGIFMFDLSRYNTLGNLEDWITFFKDGLSNEEQNIPILMVGGKNDLVEKRSVSREDALELKNQYNFFDYIECSSKTGENVDPLFNMIVREMMKNFDK